MGQSLNNWDGKSTGLDRGLGVLYGGLSLQVVVFNNLN
jgi:hypothetical protein